MNGSARWVSGLCSPRVAVLGVMLTGLSCGGAVGDDDAPGGAGSSGARSSGEGGSDAGLAGMSASGGSASGSGGSAPGFGGAPTDLPGEQQILAPLATDEAVIAESEGEVLLDLTRAIGLARGYAMCRCAYRERSRSYEVGMLAEECATSETGLSFGPLDDEQFARCIADRLSGQPALTEALRCRTQWIRESGRFWLEHCAEALAGKGPTSSCQAQDDETLLNAGLACQNPG